MTVQLLRSQLDSSFNQVLPHDDGGYIESRFVQRIDDTIIVYLSSATGCDRACRFCHLTQTGQTMMTHVTPQGYLDQAIGILDTAYTEGRLKGVSIVHFNFMARGDALLNPYFIGQTQAIIHGLNELAEYFKLEAKFKISTIFPATDGLYGDRLYVKSWIDDTLTLHPEIEFYYSLYSLNPEFRKRWIPKAVDPKIVGFCFEGSIGQLRLHHALIEGENTSAKDIAAIGQWLQDYDIHSRFNIVRYNPFNEKSGREPSWNDIESYRKQMDKLGNIISTHVITRIGNDVQASCGMFVA